MSLLLSQMRNQQINYCFGALSLHQFRESKVNQGRQSLALHLTTDITDRLELGFEPFSPATLSISLSRCAVGCKDQSPVSADPFFVPQFIRIEAQRPFGVLIARLHWPAQLTPPEQIAQFPLQMVTHIKSRFIGPILLLMRSDQSDASQLADLSSLCRCPILFHRLALTITKADRLKSPIRQLLVPFPDRDPLPFEVDVIIRFSRANINHILAGNVLADLSTGVPTIHHHRTAITLLDSPVDQVTSQIQLTRKRDLPVRMGKADALENLTQVFAFLALLLLTFKHLRAVFDRVLLEPLDGFLDIHLLIPAQFQWIIDLPVSVVDRRRVFAQQFQAALIDRSRRPGVLGEKTVEAALVLDLHHKRPIDRLNGFVLGHKQTRQVASKMFKLLWAKQILIALSILLNKGRYLDQGQHMASFRFWCRKPVGSHSSSAQTKAQPKELPQKSSKKEALKKKALHGIHRPHRRLGHGQMHGPLPVARCRFEVATGEKPIRAVGQDRIFAASARSLVKEVEWLIGHLSHDSHDRAAEK